MSVVHDDAVVLTGKTDASGVVQLTADQQTLLAKQYQAHPSSLWLMYPGQVVQLIAQVDDPNWDEQTKMLHALSAADFSDDVHPHVNNLDASCDLKRARSALNANNSMALLDKLKKQ